MAAGADPQLAFTVKRRVEGTQSYRVFATNALDAQRRFVAGECELLSTDIEPTRGRALSATRTAEHDRAAA